MQGEKVRLRAVEPEDLEFLYRIENDEETWEVSARREPYSRYALKQYVASVDKTIFDRGQLRFMIETLGGETVGTLDFSGFDSINSRAELGIYIAKEFRREGYAQEAIQIALSYAKKYIRLYQAYALVAEGNKPAQGLFADAGFVHTSTLKDWLLKSSGAEDVLVFQRIV